MLRPAGILPGVVLTAGQESPGSAWLEFCRGGNGFPEVAMARAGVLLHRAVAEGWGPEPPSLVHPDWVENPADLLRVWHAAASPDRLRAVDRYTWFKAQSTRALYQNAIPGFTAASLWSSARREWLRHQEVMGVYGKLVVPGSALPYSEKLLTTLEMTLDQAAAEGWGGHVAVHPDVAKAPAALRHYMAVLRTLQLEVDAVVEALMEASVLGVPPHPPSQGFSL